MQLGSLDPPRFPVKSNREQRVAVVEQAVLASLETWNIKRQVKGELLRAGISSPRGKDGASTTVAEIENILDQTGAAVRLKNLIYETYRQASAAPPAPPPGLTAQQVYVADKLDYVERAKLKWEKRIRQELDAMAAELGVPLQRKRKDEPIVKPPPEDQPIRFVYDDNDLLDVISGISNPNHVATGSKTSATPSWGLIKVEVEVCDLEELRGVFAELDPSTGKHLGADDDTRAAYLGERIAAFRRALQVGYIPLLRLLCRRGCPHSVRPAVWKLLLGGEVGDKEVIYLEQIHASLRQWELITDELFRLDVTITSNDDNYFVFEELLSDTVAAMSRDPWLVSHAAVKSQANETFYADSNQREAAVFPPCGVVPFRGIVMYATPVCYLFAEPAELYFVYRALYAQYCCRLHTVSSQTGDILQLSRQFECVFQESHPHLYYHLLAIAAPPLKLVFNWIVFAFAGYLEVGQVMALWDRILAWDSLLVVPVAAAAILAFREKRLLECTCADEVHLVLADASTLQVVQLLQLYLFKDRIDALRD